MINFTVIDWIFISLTFLMIIHGYVKGFVEELFSWAAIVLAIWMGVLLNSAVAAFIRERVMQNVRVVPEILAFIAVFILIMIIVKLLERVLKDVIEGANLGAVNKMFGALFGLVEGAAFSALIIFVLIVQPFFDTSNLLEESLFASFLLPIIRIPLNLGQETVEAVFLMLSEIPG